MVQDRQRTISVVALVLAGAVLVTGAFYALRLRGDGYSSNAAGRLSDAFSRDGWTITGRSSSSAQVPCRLSGLAMPTATVTVTATKADLRAEATVLAVPDAGGAIQRVAAGLSQCGSVPASGSDPAVRYRGVVASSTAVVWSVEAGKNIAGAARLQEQGQCLVAVQVLRAGLAPVPPATLTSLADAPRGVLLGRDAGSCTS